MDRSGVEAPREWTDGEAQALLDLVAAVSRHRDRARLFDGLAGELAKMFEFDVLGIAVDDRRAGMVRPYYVLPRQDLPPIPREESTLLAAFERGDIMHIRSRDEVGGDPVVRRNLERVGSHSAMAIPFHSEGQPIGALVLQSKRPHAFDAVDAGLAREAALIVGIALGNCLAYDDLRRARDGLEIENQTLRDELAQAYSTSRLVAESAAMRELMRLLELVAPTDAAVLVTGESGTGKELLARAVHERSARAARPLVKLNCAAIPSGLVESELFGHEEGAFTGASKRRRGRFELANKGTLFLDEIGELPAEAQAKLLRVLQHQELERVGGADTIKVDVRIIAATNQDLETMAKAGKFRPDLYYRLAVFPLHIPPLRERREDIPPLVRVHTLEAARRLGMPLARASEIMVGPYLEYDWPGNVRELVNVVERVMILSMGGVVDVREVLGLEESR